MNQEALAAIRSLTDQCAALTWERDELQKQVWRYEKNGVTCQTHRNKVEQSCSECNVQENYTSPPAQRKPLTSQERDAKRWRFLMENSYDSKSVTQFHVWEHSWEPHSQTGEPTEWKQRVRGIALIDFIDRAIEAAHGIKENT